MQYVTASEYWYKSEAAGNFSGIGMTRCDHSDRKAQPDLLCTFSNLAISRSKFVIGDIRLQFQPWSDDGWAGLAGAAPQTTDSYVPSNGETSRLQLFVGGAGDGATSEGQSR